MSAIHDAKFSTSIPAGSSSEGVVNNNLSGRSVSSVLTNLKASVTAEKVAIAAGVLLAVGAIVAGVMTGGAGIAVCTLAGASLLSFSSAGVLHIMKRSELNQPKEETKVEIETTKVLEQQTSLTGPLTLEDAFEQAFKNGSQEDIDVLSAIMQTEQKRAYDDMIEKLSLPEKSRVLEAFRELPVDYDAPSITTSKDDRKRERAESEPSVQAIEQEIVEDSGWHQSFANNVASTAKLAVGLFVTFVSGAYATGMFNSEA